MDWDKIEVVVAMQCNECGSKRYCEEKIYKDSRKERILEQRKEEEELELEGL